MTDCVHSRELIRHPVVVTNFRGIFNEHIAAHIMAFVLAFARGLHYYIPRQLRREWQPEPPDAGTVYLPESTALIIGVGGFLGAGEKDVAVPFNAVQFTNKNNNKWYLVMNATKDALKNAKGFKYDRSEMKWIPEESSATTGAPARNR